MTPPCSLLPPSHLLTSFLLAYFREGSERLWRSRGKEVRSEQHWDALLVNQGPASPHVKLHMKRLPHTHVCTWLACDLRWDGKRRLTSHTAEDSACCSAFSQNSLVMGIRADKYDWAFQIGEKKGERAFEEHKIPQLAWLPCEPTYAFRG